MKTASLIRLGIATIAVLLVAVYVVVDGEVGELELRVAELEERMETMAPIENLMRGYQPDGPKGDPYGAVQVVGDPDVGVGRGDSARAWCPAGENEGEEWLVVEFGVEVEAVAVRVVENFNGGAVVRLEVLGEADQVQVVWEGDNVEGQDIVVGETVVVERLRVVLDTAKVRGWNEIDAVGMVKADGEVVWGTGAEASSFWSG